MSCCRRPFWEWWWRLGICGKRRCSCCRETGNPGESDWLVGFYNDVAFYPLFRRSFLRRIICFPNALIHSYTDWKLLISYPKNSQAIIIDAYNNSGRKICACYIPTNVKGITTPAAMIIGVANTAAHRHARTQPFLC